MANIIIAGVKIPFIRGGQEALVLSLAKELGKLGHCVDIVEIPFSVTPKEVSLKEIALWRGINMESFAGKKVDLLITTKYPSYYLKHPRKSVWLVHQFREMYDLYGGRFSDFSDDVRDEEVRHMLSRSETKVLSEAKYLSGISKNVVDRLLEFNRLKAEVLYPPLPLGSRYYASESQGYILSVGRLCTIKRVDILIKALPHIPVLTKLKIVGSPDEPGIMEYYQNEISKHHLQDRVEFLGRVSDDKLLELYANCLAVYYAPQDEDYGYVTLEAFASAKAVVAATDSGGVLEFVKHEQTGLIQEPNSESIAQGISRLSADGDLAKRLGANGRKFIEDSGFDSAAWNTVIAGLLSPLES